jgi:hypothetical protein
VEALGELGVALQVPVQDLDRHDLVERDLAGAIHPPHGSDPEKLQDLEVLGDDPADELVRRDGRHQVSVAARADTLERGHFLETMGAFGAHERVGRMRPRDVKRLTASQA